ncbi:DNA polymerase III subunit gamma/tau C-terminal domain-containing protein, partial [Methylogaea oryzae]|uniref:DNA polymerase III subunit gamma/tau C-terminal domain-containing protein n=1 Tax=Methylogaea oryzae TaxID=1295382 RepID=UPI0026E522D4
PSQRRLRTRFDSRRPMAAGAGQDWLQMIQAMGIVGMTQQLAANCVLQGVDDGVCTLVLDPKHQHLRTKQVEGNLHKALQNYFGTPVKLVIRESAEVKQETPAEHLARAKAERQQAAEREIEGDATVAAFQEVFDAQVVPGSIQPLD